MAQQIRFALLIVSSIAIGCSADSPSGPTGDCSMAGQSCAEGFACVEQEPGTFRCRPTNDGQGGNAGQGGSAGAGGDAGQGGNVGGSAGQGGDAGQGGNVGGSAGTGGDAGQGGNVGGSAGQGGSAGTGGAGGGLNVDTDNDGIPDGQDNCPNVSNPNQEDGDGDTAGDACDAEPTVANFTLSGQLLTIGGTSVDDTHTLNTQTTLGQVEATDGTLTLKGKLTP